MPRPRITIDIIITCTGPLAINDSVCANLNVLKRYTEDRKETHRRHITEGRASYKSTTPTTEITKHQFWSTEVVIPNSS